MGASGSKSKFDALKDSRTVMQIRDKKVLGKSRNNCPNYIPRAPHPPPQLACNYKTRPMITCKEP